PWASLDPSVKEPAQKLYDALWKQLIAVLQYRDAEGRGHGSADQQAVLNQTASRIKGRRAEQRELLQSLDFESDTVAWRAGPPAGAGPGASGAGSPPKSAPPPAPTEAKGP